ncbi:hypothetical protein BDL97_08G021100 [Sphagnum fallax]|nr:hypothetical protein BDL97_08G021100 [Sphagnum fallax]
MQVMGFVENDVAITLLAALAGFLALWVLLTKWQQGRAGGAGGGAAAAAAGVVDGTRLTSTKMPPGSLGWPIIGETFSFLSDVKNHPQGLYGFLAKRYARYGPVWRTNIIGMTGVFFHGPQAFKTVMLGEHTLFTYKQFKSTGRILGENSMFFADEELHRKMRKQFGEPLSMDGLRRNFTKFQETAINNLSKWEGRTVCVIDEAADYALDNIVYMMTSWKPGDPDFECIKANFMYLMDGIASIPFMWLRGRYYRAIKAHERMCKTLLQVVERRQSGQEKHDDFIQHLVDCEALQNEAEKQSDLQLLDNLVLMMFAGHETSSITIMWLLKYLEDNPLVQETLREEHEEILRKKVNPDALLTWEEASSMPYTLKVLSETLRLSSFMQWLPREANNDIDINGFRVKKGWKVFMDLRAGHHDPALFKDPLEFQPSRFEEPVKPFSFVAFGAGPRLCLGMNLAKLEISLFVHFLVTKYRWESVNKDFSLAPYVFLKLRNGYQIHVTPIIR